MAEPVGKAEAERVITESVAASEPLTSLDDVRTVKAVQARLLQLGYVDGGPADGQLDGKTKDEILAMRRREGLPLTPTIDTEFLTQLLVASPKVVSQDQKTATVVQIAPKVEAVKQTWRTRFWAKITAWNSVIAAAILAISNNFETAVNIIAPVKNLLSEVPGWIWLVCIGGIASLIAWQAGHTEQSMVDGYRAGTVKNDNREEGDP